MIYKKWTASNKIRFLKKFNLASSDEKQKMLTDNLMSSDEIREWNAALAVKGPRCLQVNTITTNRPIA